MGKKIKIFNILLGGLAGILAVILVFQIFLSSRESTSEEEIAPFLYIQEQGRSTPEEVIEAYCKQTNEGFVVLRGSHIERNDAEYLNESMKKRRKFAKIDENNILQEDILFSSPSYAAVFVLGYNSNGLDVWKTKDGIKLKDLENNI